MNAGPRSGWLVAARYEDSGPVAYKGAHDIVTEVDHAAEALVRAGLAERFPDDSFYGEESGRDPTVALRAGAVPGRWTRRTADSRAPAAL